VLQGGFTKCFINFISLLYFCFIYLLNFKKKIFFSLTQSVLNQVIDPIAHAMLCLISKADFMKMKSMIKSCQKYRRHQRGKIAARIIVISATGKGKTKGWPSLRKESAERRCGVLPFDSRFDLHLMGGTSTKEGRKRGKAQRYRASASKISR
jgi:hypothetical protein